MKTFYFLCLFILAGICQAQVKLASWNIQNFGQSKTDASIAFIAGTVKDFDIVALQEVVSGPGGAQAVARLAAELNRKGAKWDYTISDPTTGTPSSSERYAFLWKTAKVTRQGKAWLEPKYRNEIDREPFMCVFSYKSKSFTVASFHAVPKNKHPENEIRCLRLIPGAYPAQNIIFLGDFNCPQSNEAFMGLKLIGYGQAFRRQKTSLKMKCTNDGCLASEYDNIWFRTAKIRKTKASVVPFYGSFPSLKEARRISDHIPVMMEFELN